MTATFSPCGRYRYSLTRRITPMFPGPSIMFVMLNPSTADASSDDATIRRCIGYARRWGFAELVVTNLSPLRATDPAVLKATGSDPDLVAARNRNEVTAAAESADRIVVAWGAHGSWEGRDKEMMATLAPWLDKVYCLGQTDGGQPLHPVRLPSTIRPYRCTGNLQRGEE